MADWSKEEVEAAVSDYLEMLASELAGVAYNKREHNRKLAEKLSARSPGSIEYKHANISAALIDLGFPYIAGYKPRANYQALMYDLVAQRLSESRKLLDVAAADADQPIVVPEVDDILAVLTSPPLVKAKEPVTSEPRAIRVAFAVNYLEREARNRSLGAAGEEFVINFERARLIHLKQERLAAKIEHTSKVRGDGQGFDVLSFEETGEERLIEVKTTKYGEETPFFVSRNELAVSETRFARYRLYRLFRFKAAPRLFILDGALSRSCTLAAAVYTATVRASEQ